MAGKPNHLIHEKSPYLLQHARNPVDWHPWGEEAFEKARREDKPILVSIGYSTCHWCHVMERESFSNPEIAAVMNENLVCIKVDREERPDLDKIYMTAAQALTGAGGWPLNVFLTPDLKPFYGGTYFPPDERWGRMSWPDLVRRIGESWRDAENRKKIAESADSLTDHLRQFLSEGASEAGDLSLSLFEHALGGIAAGYDPQHGGFGPAPKFPMPVIHRYLLRYWRHASRRPGLEAKAAEALEMSLNTLRKMAGGGIHDQIGGGFHRYSTDERWQVPHFEKMLYDNAQLAVCYLEAFQASGDPAFARVARETLEYVLLDLSDPGGGFYSAEDADSLPAEFKGRVDDSGHEHRVEGAFYVWTKKEILDLLGPGKGEIFCDHFGVKEEGNAESDPHGEFKGKNILHAVRSPLETAAKFGKTEEDIGRLIGEGRCKLFGARSKRPRPHLDDKILTSWNGLMISAMALGAQVLGDEKYRAAAERAAGFVFTHLYDREPRQLYRRWRDGERKVNGTADDYAFLVQGLVDLYEASFSVRWLEWAAELAEETNRRFLDPKAGGFFMTEEGSPDWLLLRVKEDADNVEPSASSVAALNLLRLAEFTDRRDFAEAAEKTLRHFVPAMRDYPRAVPQMLAALHFALAGSRQIVLLGPTASEGTRRLLGEVRQRFLPDKVLALAEDDAAQKALSGVAPFVASLRKVEDRPTAFVCVGRACDLPVTDPQRLASLLDEGGVAAGR